MSPEQGLPRRRGCMSRWFGPLSSGSLRSGTLVLTTTALGAGVLTLPFAVKELGWALGAAMIALLGLLNVTSLEVLLDAGMEHSVNSYHDLVAKLQGPVAAGFLDFTIIVSNVGSSAAYMVFIKQLLPSLLVVTFRVPDAVISPEIVLAGVTLITFVAALPQKITALSQMCFLGVVSVLYISILLLCNALTTHLDDGITDLQSLNMKSFPQTKMSWAEVTNAASLIMLGFLCQFNVFFICSDIKDPTAKRLRKITRRSTCFQIGCYMLVGLCGYITFGDSTHDNVFTNFAPDDRVANFGRLLVCGSMLVAIPLSTFSTRATIVDILSQSLGNMADLEIHPDALSAARSVKSLHRAYAYSLDVASDDSIVISPASHVSRSGLKVALLDVEGGQADQEQLGRVSYVVHVASTFLILFTALILAILLPGVSTLLGKLGGFCGVTQMYVLPGMILMQCQGLRPAPQRLGILASFAAATLLGLAALIL